MGTALFPEHFLYSSCYPVLLACVLCTSIFTPFNARINNEDSPLLKKRSVVIKNKISGEEYPW